MRWLAAGLALAATVLLVGSALASLRWRQAQLGPLRWAWLVVLSRLLLCLPLVTLSLSAGAWPSVKVTAFWLASASLLTLFADILDRVWTYRAVRAHSSKSPP